MSETPYGNDKMAWLAYHEGFPPTAPTQVQMILSDLCQQDCVNPDGTPWCAYRMPGNLSNELFVGESEVSKFGHSNPKRFMPTDRALSLLEEMKAAGVQAVQFTGGGEPLLAPGHKRIFEHALELGFKCSLVSNGVALTPEVIHLLPRFSWVRISVDAGTSETYSKTRTTHPSNFAKVLNNLSSIAMAIRRAESECVLGMGFVVMPHNWQELELGTLVARAADCQNIRLSAMFGPDDEKPYLEIYDDIKREIDKAKTHETDNFKVYDLFGDRIEDLRLGNPDYPVCAKMHYCSYVGADMQLYICCVYSYNQRGKLAGDLGNLKERRFDEFWASEERRQFMESFDPRGCERCQFNPSNRAVNALLSKIPPLHIEFP
jgi:MoaA/NifB/PqqE/SkfB family radical SAM enzyme